MLMSFLAPSLHMSFLAAPAEECAQAVVHQVVQIEHAQMRHQLGQLDQKREHKATEHAASQLSHLISIASAYSQKFFRLSLQNACNRQRYGLY